MRNRRRISTGGSIVIRGGQVIDKHLARIVCRCGECLGEVEYWGAGLACRADKSHRGLIHRREAAAEAERRAAEMVEVQGCYVIRDGHLVALTDHTK